MFGTLIEDVIASYRAPRPTVRRVIDRMHGWREVAMLFGLAFCLSTGVAVLMALAGGEGAVGLGFVLSNLVFSAAAYLFAVLLIHRLGRAFGGQGALIEIAAAVAWHSLVTVIFAPLVAAATLAGGEGGASGVLAIAQLGMIIVVIWLLANFVAEAHGFLSAARVAGGLVAGAILLGLILSLLFSGLISR